LTDIARIAARIYSSGATKIAVSAAFITAGSLTLMETASIFPLSHPKVDFVRKFG